MADYANPQSLNRFSYVNNHPLRYADPTGHMRVDDPGDKEGCSDPKYCRNGKPKPKEELADMRRAKKERDWPSDPVWDTYPVAFRNRPAIDVLFNPWVGSSFVYELDVRNPESLSNSLQALSQQSNTAYANAGLDLREIIEGGPSDTPLNNLLTEVQAIELIPALNARRGWRPYNEFLKALGLGTGPDYITNYEPAYLEALMVDNPQTLKDVKDQWEYSMINDPNLAEIEQLLQHWKGLGPPAQ